MIKKNIIDKLFYLWYCLLLFSIYPIMGLKIRTDHIFVYLGFILFFFSNKFIYIPKYILYNILLQFLIMALWPIYGNYLNNTLNYENTLNIISGIENFLSCFCCIYITVSYIELRKRDPNFSISETTSIILKINLFVICANVIPQLYFLYTQCSRFILMISGASKCGEGASDIAILGGRTGGIFDQVIEGGFAYSIALISLLYLCYLIGFKKYFVYILNSLIFGIILVGSKLSYLIGLPLFVILFIRDKLYKNFFKINILYVYLIFIIGIFLIYNSWNGKIPIQRGLVYIERLYFPIINLIKKENLVTKKDAYDLAIVYSSGRFSSSANISEASKISSNNLIKEFSGSGYGKYPPADNLFRDINRQGGYISLLSCIYVMIFLTVLAFRSKAKSGFFALVSLIVLLIAGSMGSSILTGNRVCYLFFITFIFIYYESTKRRIL